jgi:hypothetical protein
MSSWTPGPWVDGPSVGINGRAVICINDDEWHEIDSIGLSASAQANARLVRAAPEMAELLRHIGEECITEEYWYVDRRVIEAQELIQRLDVELS